ncbi:TRAP transporter substrate-binding protein [Pikeienuella sp. HZG-20]|uniref:TRAP transporter substrate-binding protein n=1 Tax=Paludibacillus litoralis TaxID=3133267 RepID=UPI0030EE0D7A
MAYKGKVRAASAAIALGCMTMFMQSGDAIAETFEIKISHAANTKHPIHVVLEKFKELAEERSEGRLEVSVFHSSQLAGQREGVEGLQLGTIEIVAIPNGVAAGFDPAFMLLDIPFQFDDIEHARNVVDAVGETLIFSDLEGSGLVGLAIWEQGYRNLGTTKPLESGVAGVSDLKLRTMEAPLHITAWRALGANPTPMGWAQVFTSLQQGVVDGVEIPSYLFTQTGVHEVIQQVTLTHHIYDSVIVLGSKKRFDAMPEDLRDIVQQTMRELTSEERDINQRDVEEAEQQLRDLGVEVIELDAAQMAKFREVAQPPVLEDVANQVPQEKLDAWLAATEQAR